MSKFQYKRKVLLIDGNYFGHRILHGHRISNPDFTLTSPQQRFNFESMLNDALITIYKAFNNDFHKLIDNVIFVFDNYSWRKGVRYPVLDEIGEPTTVEELFKPYYITPGDDTLLGYKENRKKLKDSTDIDWEMFNVCLKNFKSRIQETIACLDTKGAEGDDNIFFLTNELSKHDILTIMFATDGDLKSNVKDNVIYLKNVKSSKSPDGEFVISPNMFNEMFGEKSIVDIMLGEKIDMDYYNNLFKIDIANPGNSRSNKVRVKNENIYPATHYRDLAIKVVCGDKKDNILPLFRWTKNGKHFKVTELMLAKAFKSVEDMDFTEETAKLALTDKKLMSRVLVALSEICNQPREILKLIGKHYYHNLALNELSFESIPKEVFTNFNEAYHKNIDLINKDLQLIEIQSLTLNTQTNDSAKNLMVDSIIRDEQNNVPQGSSNQLVNDILNS